MKSQTENGDIFGVPFCKVTWDFGKTWMSWKKGEKMGRIFKGKDEGSRQGAAAAFKAAVMAVVISAFYILHATMF